MIGEWVWTEIEVGIGMEPDPLSKRLFFFQNSVIMAVSYRRDPRDEWK